MTSKIFSNVFMFLTKLAWQNRIAIPFLVTTAFLIMDIRLQIEINIHSGQYATVEMDDDNFADDDDEIYEEYTTDSSNGGDENSDDAYFELAADQMAQYSNIEFEDNSTQIRDSLGLS